MSTEAPAPSPHSPGHTSRRRALGLLGAGGAALFASLLGRDEARAGHDGSNVMHLGVANTNPPGPPTSLNTSGPVAFFASAQSEGGAAVSGRGPDTHDPNSEPGAGVQGFSAFGPGVVGESSTDEGIRGESRTGNGVAGVARATGGVGVLARTEYDDGDGPQDAVALEVLGRVRFERAGAAVIPAGKNEAFVADPYVRDSTHISVTLASDPGQREIRWVERQEGANPGFTVHLTPAPRGRRPETALTYFSVELFEI